MFAIGDRIRPIRDGDVDRRKRIAGSAWSVSASGQVAAEPKARKLPDSIHAVSDDGVEIYVTIYPDGQTYNGLPLGRTIGWRLASDYERA